MLLCEILFLSFHFIVRGFTFDVIVLLLLFLKIYIGVGGCGGWGWVFSRVAIFVDLVLSLPICSQTDWKPEVTEK